MKTILLLGKNGQVGWELERSLAHLGKVIALDRQSVDFENNDSLIRQIRDVRPSIIVNAAAYTAVDKAETEEALAMQVNGTAPGIIAEEAKRLKAILVHYSTDYVFNGDSSKPYQETDAVDPLNVYGKSKLAGEQMIQAVGGSHLILRTSWVYGTRGKNFLLTMLKLAKERDQLKIVMDQIGAPTWSKMIAEGTAQILAKCVTAPRNDLWGIYHMTAAGQTSWFQFAESIFRLGNQRSIVPIPQVIGIPASEYPLPAKRPAYSVLSNAKLHSAFGISLFPWDKALELCMYNYEN